MKIFYSSDFKASFESLDFKLKKSIIIKIGFLKKDPLHPSLRMHPLKGELKGFWSIMVNHKYRIIFRRKENGDILFYSVGKHDVYKNL